VELLSWLASQVSGWDEFAPKPRGAPEPEQVLLAISAAHKTIEDYEWQQSAPPGSGWLGQASADAAVDAPAEPPVRCLPFYSCTRSPLLCCTFFYWVFSCFFVRKGPPGSPSRLEYSVHLHLHVITLLRACCFTFYSLHSMRSTSC
jgi:hypothetical protein